MDWRCCFLLLISSQQILLSKGTSERGAFSIWYKLDCQYFRRMKEIAVIGAGTMGNGIAHVFAQHGYAVTLVDVQSAALERALSTIAKNLDRQVAKGKIDEGQKSETLRRLSTATQLDEAIRNADLIVEAATENQEVKLNIFKQIDAAAKDGAILATNTSSISITQIAAATQRPEAVIGMHFMNPVPVMKLVEVIRGYATSDQTNDQVVALSEAIGKTPVEVNDYPGFVANRILMPMINEAIYTLWQGVAKVEAIDTVMMLGMAHPMGPLHLADFIGLDVCLSIMRVLHQGLGLAKYAPCPLLVNMVAAGKLGKKTGEGFYRYTPGSKEKVAVM